MMIVVLVQRKNNNYIICYILGTYFLRTRTYQNSIHHYNYASMNQHNQGRRLKHYRLNAQQT